MYTKASLRRVILNCSRTEESVFSVHVQVSVAEYKGPYRESAEVFCSCCVPAVHFCPGRSFCSNPTACFDPTHPQHSKGKPPLSSSCQPNQQCVEVSQTYFNWSWSLSLLPLHAHQKKILAEDVQSWLVLSGVRWHAMAGFCVSIQDSHGATLPLVPLCSIVVVPLTGGGGGGRMRGDATLVCSATVAGGIHSANVSRGERDMNFFMFLKAFSLCCKT